MFIVHQKSLLRSVDVMRRLLTSADKGKTHTSLACESASGQVIPPFMFYPSKRPVPEKMRIGAYPDTVFHVSDSGWMTKELFFE